MKKKRNGKKKKKKKTCFRSKTLGEPESFFSAATVE